MTDDDFVHAPIRPAMPVRRVTEAADGLCVICRRDPHVKGCPNEGMIPFPISALNAEPEDMSRPKPTRDRHVINHNRPKELKERLSAVLAATDTLSRSEGKVFREVLGDIDKLSRTSRRRIIEALARVYP